jgi:hypothetical protein
MKMDYSFVEYIYIQLVWNTSHEDLVQYEAVRIFMDRASEN